MPMNCKFFCWLALQNKCLMFKYHEERMIGQPYTIPDADGETVLHLVIIQCSCIRCCSVADCFSIVNNFVAAIVPPNICPEDWWLQSPSYLIRVHSKDIFFIYLAIVVCFLPCNWLNVCLRTKHSYK